MRLLSTFVAVLLVAGAPAALLAQAPARLSPADSALVERLSAQYKAAGEAKDYAEGIRLAVRIGTITRNAALLHKMGHYYEAGSEQIPKDDAEAVRVFMLAADFGDAEAQHHIALRHFQGRGVELDSSRGATLMERSADRGYGPAKAVIYELELKEGQMFGASGRAAKCAMDELKRIGYFGLSDAAESGSGEATFLRVREKAPSMAAIRGDAVTVVGPTNGERTRRFALTNVTGFIGITEKAIDGSQLKYRSLDQRLGVSPQGAGEIERVRTMCTPR
jgi:TPR repeat protein